MRMHQKLELDAQRPKTDLNFYGALHSKNAQKCSMKIFDLASIIEKRSEL